VRIGVIPIDVVTSAVTPGRLSARINEQMQAIHQVQRCATDANAESYNYTWRYHFTSDSKP
jgi:hypothetical protein